VAASYYDHLLDNSQQFTEDTKSTKDYAIQFDESLICCNALGTENDVQVLS